MVFSLVAVDVEFEAEFGCGITAATAPCSMRLCYDLVALGFVMWTREFEVVRPIGF